MERGNLFDLDTYRRKADSELFETLFSAEDCKAERIVSAGHITPEGQWYDQPLDEWVILLQGNAKLEFAGGETMILKAGDYVFLPAHRRHRVAFTSTDPPCIWLAVHGRIR